MKENRKVKKRKLFRRSLLYVPGNMPRMLHSILSFDMDTIIIDLGDAVRPENKLAARILVRNFLKTYDFGDVEVFIRINQIDSPYGFEDLKMLLPEMPDGIRLPRSTHMSLIKEVDMYISQIEDELEVEDGRFSIIASIDTAIGVLNVQQIAQSSSRICALAFDAEHYTLDLGIERTKENESLLFARMQVLLTAKAMNIDAIDTIFSDVYDEEGLIQETRHAKSLGFTGKSLISPRQIIPVHNVFAPTKKEIEFAQRIISAAEQARKRRIGVISLDGKLVDSPAISRAELTLKMARDLGLVMENE